MKHISGMIHSIAGATLSAALLLAPGAGWAENGQSSERHETVNERQEQQAREEAERKRKEAERRLKEQQLEALAEQARQERGAEARAREARIFKYQPLIRDRLTQVWYPPSSATETMVARLQITLLPTGELDSVRLVGSSGNQDFDDSALDAVRSVNRYPVPDDRATFERYFRQFTIEFNPQRLR